jgi:predicted transglutaminase-like protease
MHNISKKYSNQQKFKYFEKHKNLKEQRKTKRLPRNKKRYAKNAKILGEIREKTTQHDMINQ